MKDHYTNLFNSPETNRRFVYAAILIVGLYFLIAGIIHVQSILAPIAIALLLALSFVPLASKLEKLGISRTVSSLICTLIVSLVFCLLGWALIEYGADIRSELPQLWEEIKPRINDLSVWIANKFGLEELDILERAKNYLEGSFSSIGAQTLSVGMGVLSGLGNVILMVVYMFFILNFRRHLANFLYRLTSDRHDKNVRNILQDSVDIVRKYLVGRLILIVILSICYGVGYMVIGLDYAWAIAIVSAIFSILPIVGNIIAAGLSSIIALLTTGDIMMVVWVLTIFAVTQFLESYILTPLILGKEVDLNPFFTVVVVLIGGALWGFEGYLLALPYFGILKVILEQSESTKPYAYLLANDNTDEDLGGKMRKMVEKIKS
jgi:predicted PurR-regulated permease PerM